MNNVRYYFSIDIFWNNSSEDKPDADYRNNLEFKEIIGNIEFTDEWGVVIFYSKKSDIGAISLMRNLDKMYLVREVKETSNNLFKYTLEEDIWLNYTLPFLIKQKELYPVRSEIDRLFNPILKDSMIEDVEKIYNDYEDKFIGLDNSWVDNSVKISRRDVSGDGNIFGELKDVSLRFAENTYNPGNIYFIFTKDIKISGTYFGVENFEVFNSEIKSVNDFGVDYEIVNNSSYVALPVLENQINIDGWRDVNTFDILNKMSKDAPEGQFIGIFQGPPFKYKSTSIVNDVDGGVRSLKWFGRTKKIPGNVTGLLSSLFTIIGFNEFAKLPLPEFVENRYLKKYHNIVLGNDQWRGKDYFINSDKELNISFNGGGFYGFIYDPNTPNYELSTFSYGSYLPATTSSYNNYINSNKSSINAGLRAGEQSAVAGVVNSTISNPMSLSTSLLSSIGQVGNSYRMINAKKKDLKRNDKQILQASDIMDTITGLINSRTKLFIKFTKGVVKYKVQKLSDETMTILNYIIERFGFVSQGVSNFEELSRGIPNKETAYFELDVEFTKGLISNMNYPKNIFNLVGESISYGVRIVKTSIGVKDE